MSRSTTYRSGDVAWNGKGLLIFPLEQLTNAAAAQYGGGFCAPCSGTIVSLTIAIATAFTHADAAVAFGLVTDIDSHLNDYDLTNVAAGEYDLVANVLMLSTAITKGLGYTWSLAASDTTGVLTGVVVIEPT